MGDDIRTTGKEKISIPSREELLTVFEQSDEHRWLQLEWMLDRHDHEQGSER